MGASRVTGPLIDLQGKSFFLQTSQLEDSGVSSARIADPGSIVWTLPTDPSRGPKPLRLFLSFLHGPGGLMNLRHLNLIK